MKRDAINSTKLKKLCKHLGLRVYMGVGLMESIWHLTAREAPQGDIGKLSNEDIALGVDFEGDPDQLIDALIKSRWIDESDAHRLIIHGWHEHSDDTIDVKLARALLLYANGSQPRMKRLSTKERAFLCEQYSALASLSAQERTGAHKGTPKSALPEPVPEPEPVPIRTAKAVLLRTVPPEELAGTLPLIDGSNYEISKSQLKDWAKAFPAVDVKQQLLEFKEWAKANPTHRKTRKGILRSVFHWLSREQDRAGTGGNLNGRSATQSKQNATIGAYHQVLAGIRGVDRAGADADRGPDGRGDQHGAPLFDDGGVGSP